MMYRPAITAVKVARFSSDEYEINTMLEVFYDDGTSEITDCCDFNIYADGRFVEVSHD